VSGFDELRRLGVVFRPIDTWPGVPESERARVAPGAQSRSPWFGGKQRSPTPGLIDALPGEHNRLRRRSSAAAARRADRALEVYVEVPADSTSTTTSTTGSSTSSGCCVTGPRISCRCSSSRRTRGPSGRCRRPGVEPRTRSSGRGVFYVVARRRSAADRRDPERRPSAPGGAGRLGRGWGGERLGRMHLSRAARTRTASTTSGASSIGCGASRSSNLDWRECLEKYDHPTRSSTSTRPTCPRRRGAAAATTTS
jgi:hypothetical protein